jgi:hypothetical protein
MPDYMRKNLEVLVDYRARKKFMTLPLKVEGIPGG